MSIVANPHEFIRGLDRAEDRFKKMFRKKVRRIVTEGMHRMIAKTPVWAGTAVANYVATGGTPYSGPVKKGGTPQKGTNRMPLGAERNRAGAKAEAMATVQAVDFSDPYKAFWITNRAPHIAGLEYGALPRRPFVPRSPAGMFAVTVEELMLLLSSGRI